MGDARLLDNWLTAYMAYTAESESPDEFHQWVAISTVAGVLRRNAYFDMGYFLLYPNLYIVLVSPAGRCRKSTAMRIARPMLAEIPGINFSVDSTTRERLIQDLTQCYNDGQSAMTAYSSEFASLLTSSGMDMVVFLTDLYDCPLEWTHRTKMSGTNKIKAPYLNLLAATTPDWIARAMPLDTIGVGLTARIIFVYSNEPRIKPPFPTLSPEQVELGEYLKKDLADISTINGQYNLEGHEHEPRGGTAAQYDEWHEQDSAAARYDKWYKRRYDDGQFSDSRLSGYFERKSMHLLKTSMIVAASQRCDPIITIDDLNAAKALLDMIEERMTQVFVGVGKNPLAFDLEQSLATILSNPNGVAFGTLLDMFKHSVRKQELEEVLETLRVTGHIRMVQTESGPKYFPVGELP